MEITSDVSILVVDDEPDMRDIMAMTLAGDGFQADTAANGREAIDRLAEKRYDLVVCDLVMPDLDGFDVLAEVKRCGSDALFILITAHASVESAVVALRQGAYDYLLKPFEMDELSLTVQRALSHRQLMLEKEQLLEDLKERNVSLAEAHAEVRQRAEALSDMLEASHSLAHLALHPESLAPKVADIARHYFRVHVGLSTVDGDRDQLQVLYLEDLPPVWQNLLAGRQFTSESLHQFLAGAAPISRSYYLDPKMVDWEAETLPLWAGRELGEAKHPQSPDAEHLQTEGDEDKALLAVPLETRDGRLVGVLWVLSEEDPPSLESVQRLEIFCNQVAGVIENADLFAALLRQIRAREALFDVSRRIVTVLDQQEVLKSILEATLKTIPQADLVVIHHYPTADSDLTSVSLRADSAQSDPWPRGTTPSAAVDKTLIQEAIRHKNTLYLPEHSFGGTLLVLPMLLANTVRGTLSVVSGQPHAFSDDQRQLMAMLANQAAIALQNAQLFAEARRIDELEALRDVGQAINQTLDLQQTVTTTISSARSLTGASLSEIYLRESTPQRSSPDVALIRHAEVTLATEDPPPTEADQHRCAEIANQAADGRQAVFIPDLWADAHVSDTAHHLHAYLAVPLIAGETLVGVLGVGSDHVEAFTTDDLRLMQVIAGQAATAIENARLFEEVERRWEQTEALHSISQSIITTLDLTQVLELVVSSATATIPVTARSTLYLLAQPSGEFSLEASASRPGSQPAPGIEQALNRVIRLATDQHTIAYEPNATGQYGMWSLLAAPLKIGEAILGAICLESPHADAFSEDDQTMLSAFADQASIAIQNASLFNDLSTAYVDLAHSREEILRSRNALQALFDGITDGLYIVNRDMEIIAINQAEARRLGLSPTDLQGRVCDESLWGEAAGELRRLVQLSLENEQEQSWPSQTDAPNRGPFADHDVHIYPIVSTTGRAQRAIIFAYDVSEMRQLQASLFRSANLAALGQLASSIAHEINNPLTVTIGNAQLLQLEMDRSDPNYELTELIVQSGTRMRRIIQNLLDFSSQESYQFDWVEVDETVEDALTLIAHPLRKANIHVVKDMQELPTVYASGNHLKLIWMNLLLNARDAIHARNGEGEIRIEGQSSDDSVCIRVTDNGVGIPPDHFEHLFRPFFTTKSPGKRLGLGLYTCHAIISRHHGQIHIESQSGQGTTVCVSLPIQQTADGE